MWARLQKLLDRIETQVTLWQLIQWVAVLSTGGITGWLSTGVKWIDQYGYFGWWCAALVGSLAAACLLLAFAWLRYAWRKGAAMEKWKEKVDGINPMDSEFSKQRIKIYDVVDPAEPMIRDKVFIGCDLIGPANIAFLDGCNITHVGFINCDIIPVKDNIFVRNAIGFSNVTVTRSRIIGVTLLVPPNMLDKFTVDGVELIGYTKEESEKAA